jgi:apolipoprotein N-acyltransferase
VKNGAELLFIMTNDGWWEDTPGHRQHFIYAKLRAIECRRSIARSANTGISCFINQRGDVIQQTAYWEEDAIQNTINKNDRITFYVKYGDILGRIAYWTSALLLLILIVAMLKKRFTKEAV